MFCGTQVHTNSPKAQAIIESLARAKAGVPLATGEWEDTKVKFFNFSITVKHTGYHQGVTINGSLHKFYTGGYNDTTFIHEEVVEAIRRFENTFSVTARECKVEMIEIGVNIPVDDPIAIIEDAILFGGKYYGKEEEGNLFIRRWQFGDQYGKNKNYTVKLYLKGEHLLRLEFKVWRLRNIPYVHINTLNDLIIRDNWMGCLRYLANQVLERFIFIPDELIDNLEGDLRKKLGKCKKRSFWKKLTPKVKCCRIKIIRELIQERGLFDNRYLLVAGIVNQGALMLDISEEEMFSAIGLEAETIASVIKAGNSLWTGASPAANVITKVDEAPAADEITEVDNNEGSETSASTQHIVVIEPGDDDILPLEASSHNTMDAIATGVVPVATARGPPHQWLSFYPSPRPTCSWRNTNRPRQKRGRSPPTRQQQMV